MKLTFAVLIILLHIVMNTLTANAQNWQRIVPLKTTRTEVERLLGPSKEVYFAEYQLEEGKLFIEYSSGPCRPDRKGGWNVPENIVVSMSLTPKRPKRLYELKLDPTKYRRVVSKHLPSVTYYINDEDGIVYTIQMGKVDYVEYSPPKKFDDLQCKSQPIN